MSAPAIRTQIPRLDAALGCATDVHPGATNPPRRPHIDPHTAGPEPRRPRVATESRDRSCITRPPGTALATVLETLERGATVPGSARLLTTPTGFTAARAGGIRGPSPASFQPWSAARQGRVGSGAAARAQSATARLPAPRGDAIAALLGGEGGATAPSTNHTSGVHPSPSGLSAALTPRPPGDPARIADQKISARTDARPTRRRDPHLQCAVRTRYCASPAWPLPAVGTYALRVPTYIAFLRAINLGATRKFAQLDIVRATEAAGGTAVATHGNTGNVRLSSPMRSLSRVQTALEQGYAADRGFAVPTVVFSPDELRTLADRGLELRAPRSRHYVLSRSTLRRPRSHAMTGSGFGRGTRSIRARRRRHPHLTTARQPRLRRPR